jgi:hypothetical protein
MNKNHVFFSYSRDNTEFVLELAKKLRKAGADVWLDQLDIKTGERWDKSIERALSTSDVLMVVLSKSSVESNNVMDEVSYALEEGKKVLPILLEECEVPFRLRRLQFADFSQNPDDGMKVLISALDLDSSKVEPVDSSSKLAKSVSDTTKLTGSIKAPDHPSTTQSQKPISPNSGMAASTKSSKSKKPLIYALIAVVAALAIWGVFKFTSGDGQDKMSMCKADWSAMESAMSHGEELNELAALRQHIELYAPCPHENEAMDRISFLKAMGGELETSTTENNLDSPTSIESTNGSEATSNLGTMNEERSSEKKSNESEKKKPVGVVEEVVKETALTGHNVVRVDFDGGYFKEQSGNDWIELNNNNERAFKLLKRDANAIYLGDGPDVRLTLDISKSIIYYADANNERFHLYTITKVYGKENGSK